MQVSKIKVPAIVATGIICLAVGVGIGVLWMGFFGYQLSAAARGSSQRSGGGMGGSRGSNPKIQLALLVNKLDLLSQKPLAVTLNEDQKKKVIEQLQGLEAKDVLSEEDAKARLNTLLDVLKEHQETLEAAGYRWPGQGGFRPPSDDPNPFKEERIATALKSLQQRLGEPAAK